MQGKSGTEQGQENNMQNETERNRPTGVMSHTTEPSLLLATNQDETDQTCRANHTKLATGTARSSNLNQSASVKNLITKFSGPDCTPRSGSPVTTSPFTSSPNDLGHGVGQVVEISSSINLTGPNFSPAEIALSQIRQNSKSNTSPIPSISVTPPLRTTGATQHRADPVPGGPRGGHQLGSSKKDSPNRGSAEVSPAQKTDSELNHRPADPAGKRPQINSSTDSGRESVADSGMGSESEFEPNKQPDSPASEDEPSAPRVVLSPNQNPKYQLFLSNDVRNGSSSRDADGPGGGSLGENGVRLARWESSRLGTNLYRGSLESLASRDWDTMSDRAGGFDSPPRVFNSPYATASMEYNPMYRMSEFKVQGGLSPATSELNLFSYNSRSTSPVPTPTLTSPRTHFSTYDALTRRRAEVNNSVITNHMTLRSANLGAPNKRDYIEELTKQLDACQKRNQFLEAESVEMDKERNQIRLEMRGLLVHNEDLLRANTQLNNELKRMKERMMEMERETQAMTDNCRQMEIELKEARDMMVEANTQEYAFNFLQQSLKNKIQDAEENLEKQSQQVQSLSDKLWLAERKVEEYEMDSGTKDKKTAELTSTILRLETELAAAVLSSTQAGADLSLQQKLREDVQLRMEELEEILLEKDQELQRTQEIINRLQGEVSGKLIDKERTLEEEIQLRERMQLQWKQAERTVDDLQMELQSANQSKEDLAKQVKQYQEKMIDLESDIEELHDSEQRWASKHKRSIEQTEQLQLKLLQQKDLNDQLDCEKVLMERQLRELRSEVEELQSNKVQEDVISKTESRAKELENVLRAEERRKWLKWFL
ncbi:peripherin-like isoform X2 [Lampris incognitus]|uniref:peripherin-like isoform X2 n=1 Tax=Lampris incognitus TaxID=2546036 RepID=UPI0024B5E388|nr:peripherin-like isoform X2 [Lampris incognitus]